MIRHLFAAAVLTCTVGSAYARDPGRSPTRRDTLKLDEYMADRQVVDLLGEPDAVELMTCGTAPGLRPWRCKAWQYDIEFHRLRILFQDVSKAGPSIWVVNSWTWVF